MTTRQQGSKGSERPPHTRDSCPLLHDLVKVTSPITPTEPPLSYEELSPEAKRVFNEARNQSETVLIYDKAKKPPEFHYTDERRPYVIVRNGERYQLFAYTHHGCSFPGETES